MTYKQLRENNPQFKPLITAVKKQLGCDAKEFMERLDDVRSSSCGANAGFTGFIYCTETVLFWRKNRAKIKGLMQYEADNFGDEVIGMVKNFNSVEGNFSEDEIGRAIYGEYDYHLDSHYDTFAKYALEEVAYLSEE